MFASVRGIALFPVGVRLWHAPARQATGRWACTAEVLRARDDTASKRLLLC